MIQAYCFIKLFQFLLTVAQKHRFSAAQHILLHIATILKKHIKA